MKKKAIYIMILLLVNSCGKTKNDIYNELKGDWAIYKFIYNDINYINNIYSLNVITIREGNSISVPEVDGYRKEKNAKWGFNYENNSLTTFTIQSENKFFNNTYNARYFEQPMVDKLILESKNTYLELHKL